MLHATMLNDVKPFPQLTHHAPILLIDKNNLAPNSARTTTNIPLSRLERRRVISRDWPVLQTLRRTLRLARARGFRRRRPLEEGRALRDDGLKGIDVLLRPALPNSRELYPCESPPLGAQVPCPRDEVAARRLEVYLRRRREGEVKFGREVQVQVEVLLRGLGVRIRREVMVWW